MNPSAGLAQIKVYLKEAGLFFFRFQSPVADVAVVGTTPAPPTNPGKPRAHVKQVMQNANAPNECIGRIATP